MKLGAGVSYRLIDTPADEVAAGELDVLESLDPRIEETFEAKYAGIPDDELEQWLAPLYGELQALSKVAIDERIAAGEYRESVYDPSAPTRLATDGERITAGPMTVEGPSGARVVRHVVVPEGYDAELDLLSLEYSWLAAKCGADLEEPGAVHAH